jgi:heme-degrading monooxygenase HmoA
MMVTVFRSRVRPEMAEEYATMSAKMSEIAKAMPGYVSHKGFVAEDGERCTIVEFESEETHRAWAEHAGHRKAQEIGRERFYAEFSIHVCKALRSNAFSRQA